MYIIIIHIKSLKLLVAIYRVLKHSNHSFHDLSQCLCLVNLSSIDFFVCDEYLFLMSRFNDMAFRPDGDIVVLSEIFSDQTNSWYFTDDLPHIEISSRHGFNNIMIVSLEIFYIFTRNTVLNEVIVFFNTKFRALIALSYPFEIEHRWHLLLLAVIIYYPFLFR